MGNTFSSSSSNKIQQVLVHFEGKKLRVVFNPDDYNEQGKIPLQQFRTKLAKALNVPATTLMLYQLNPQKRLGNMGATLEDYGTKNDGELLAVQDEVSKPKAPVPKTAEEKINEVVSSVEKDLGDRIDAFIKSPPADLAQREQENRVLCEVILAKTISLDNVEVETPEERQARKQAIAKLQAYHRSIDEAMNKSLAATPSETAEASKSSAQSSGNQEPAKEGPAKEEQEPAKQDTPKQDSPKQDSPKPSASASKKKSKSKKGKGKK